VLVRQFSDLTHRQKLARLKEIARRGLGYFHLDAARVRFYAEHSNVLYTVEDSEGRRYMLKVTRPGDHDLAELRAAGEWLRRINEEAPGLCMKCILSRSGDTVISVEMEGTDEPRYCSLYEWVPGVVLYRRLSRVSAERWGTLAAGLHAATERAYTADELKTIRAASPLMTWNRVFYWDEEVLFESSHHGWVSAGRREVYRAMVDRVQATLAALYDGRTQPMLIHGDLHPDNIRWHSGALTALDVEDVMWGFPIQDIAIALYYVRRRDDYPALYSAFRRGYERLRPWPVRHPDELAPHFAGRQLMFANFILKLEDFGDAERETALADYEESFREILTSE